MNTFIPDFSEDPLGDWYEKYHKLVYHHIWEKQRHSRYSGEEIADQTLEVFRRMRRRLKSGGDPIGDPKRYLVRIADRVCADAARKEAKTLETVSFYRVNDEEQLYLDNLECDEGDQPEIVAERHELLAEAIQYLEELPPDQREAIQLRYLREWGVSQIAERMGMAPSTVRGYLNKGIKQLRVRLLHEDL